MKAAVQRLREKAKEKDGTWQKRGHTLIHGIGAVISLETGKVLDLIGKYYPRFVRHVILGRVGIRKKISIKNGGQVIRGNV